MADPRSTLLADALTKTQSALATFLVPSWGLLLGQAMVLMIQYLQARDELTMGDS